MYMYIFKAFCTFFLFFFCFLVHVHVCTFSVVTSSQPVRGESADLTDGNKDGHALVESLTQPSKFDELIIGTQLPCTPGASQVLLPFIYYIVYVMFVSTYTLH